MLTGIPTMKYSQITPKIYVGPQYRERGKRTLEKLEINWSINLRIEFDDSVAGIALKNHSHIPVVDGRPPSLEQLADGVTFIHRAIVEGGKVYIHCRGGVGRAPTMAAAYFISRGFTTDEAVELIRRVRPYIEIKPIQMEQLRHFEVMQPRN
jgi:predicted protein tyrosine phosphatase